MKYLEEKELALFCYRVAKAREWRLDKALQLFVWNTVMLRWVDNETGKIGRLAFNRQKTMKSATFLIGMWEYDQQK